MLMRAAVAGIQHQRLLIMADSRPQLTQPPIGVADVVLDIGIEWIAQRGELERSDCTIPILRAQRLLAGLEIGVKLRPIGIGCDRYHGRTDRPAFWRDCLLSPAVEPAEKRCNHVPPPRR